MGIKDLLNAVNGIVVDSNIREFKGKRVAIDASGWMHKGLYGVAEDFVDSKFVDSQLYVDFILSRIRHFHTLDVEPVLVFDGKRNIMKSDTQDKRSDTRRSYIQQGRKLLDNMDKVSDSQTKLKLRAEAISNFQKGLSVTADMEKAVIGACRKMGVTVIVSPYEADAQLAQLCHTGYCHAVLTEDSDILVYSAVCGTPFPVLYKFEKSGCVQTANLGDVIDMLGTDEVDTHEEEENAIPAKKKKKGKGKAGAGGSADATDAKNKKDEKEKDKKDKGFLNLVRKNMRNTMGRRMFIQMCVLAGCDYSESIPGVGLKTALQAIVKCKTGECSDGLSNCDSRLERVVALFEEAGKKVPVGYLQRAKRAEALFHYHPVFDLKTSVVQHFLPPVLHTSMAAEVTDLTNTNDPSKRP